MSALHTNLKGEKMKKVVAKIVLASVCASAAMAQGVFVGVDGEYLLNSKIKYNYKEVSGGTTTSSSYSIKTSPVGIGLRAGYDFDKYRIYGKFNYFLEDSSDQFFDNSTASTADVSFYEFVIGADYIRPISKELKLQLGGYTGASAAFVEMKEVGVAGSNTFGMPGWVLGAKAGGIYDFDKTSAVEFGLKLDYTKYASSETIASGGDKTTEDFKRSNLGLFVGYTYKF